MKGAIFYLQKRRSEDSLIKEYTQLILEEINRLDGFVTEFLYFAKQSSPNLFSTDLNKFLKNCLNLIQRESRKKRIKTLIHLDPTLPLVKIDPHQMEQVFLNLFVNALHAMPDGGTLVVSTALRKDDQEKGAGARAVTEIKDDGVGIPQDHLKSVFDPFFSTKEGGTGLGLPISLGIVEGHGGKLQILSQEGEGTTVIVELPLGGYYLDREIEDEEESPGR
jgi:signal transduction histidine kinase